MAEPSDKRSELINRINNIAAHDHICLVYETLEEQLPVVIPFVKAGLERGEQCVYIAHENPIARISDALSAEGVEVESAAKEGALVIAAASDVYLKEGHFDPDRMIGFLEDAMDSSERSGFSALRITGEMAWAPGNPGIAHLAAYESRLNYFFQNNYALALCQYNRKRFPDEAMLDIIATHPLIIYRDAVCKNFYYVPPDEFLKTGQAALTVERLLENVCSRECAEKALMLAHEELERRVGERTEELTIANALLLKEVAERNRREEEIDAHRHHLDVLVRLRTDELTRTNEKLLNEIADVKILRGLLPVCPSCRKVRNDKGYWMQIEAYIKEHSEAEFSHNFCPDCKGKTRPVR